MVSGNRSDYEVIDCSGIRAYIVPWALPNEDMPLFVTWPPSLMISKVHVSIPEEFIVKEVLNVSKYEVEENKGKKIKILDIKRTKTIKTPSYFGVVISYSKIPENIIHLGKITIDFFDYKDELLKTLTIYARVFRPIINVINYPKVIEIRDDEITKIPLQLEYLGFGDITLDIEGIIGGRIISRGDALIYEIIRRLCERNKYERKKDLEESIRVNPLYVKNLAEKVRKYMTNPELLAGVFDEKALKEVKKRFSELDRKNELMSFLYEQVHESLINILLDIFERHPLDTVELSDSRMSLLAKIETPIEEIRLILKYRDKIGNEYRDEVQIEVNDLRNIKRGKHKIELHITIEKWKSNPLKNVKDKIFGAR